MNKKYVIKEEVSSVYCLDGNELMCTNISKDGSFVLNEDDAVLVEEDLVGEEVIDEDTGKTLSDVYEEVRRILQ